MGRYICNRLLWLIPVILGITILIFTIMYFVPGDPVGSLVGSSATEQEKEEMREKMGFNDPYIVRLGRYLEDVFLHFDFGESYMTGLPVIEEIMNRIPRTLYVALGSMVVAVILGIPLGIVAAVKQDSLADSASMIVALMGVSMPNFWFATLMVLLFALKLNWLPAMGIGSFKNYIMPIIASAFGLLANLARQSRSGMLEVIRADYITTARAKGASRWSVIVNHALPNALIPIITVIGTRLASCLAGSLILENVFSIPGVGQYMIKAINSRDYPAVQGSIIFVSVFFGVVMLLVDLIYAAVDPRIKDRYVSNGKARRKRKSQA